MRNRAHAGKMIHDLYAAGWHPEAIADGLELGLATVYRHLSKLRGAAILAEETRRYREARREHGIEMVTG